MKDKVLITEVRKRVSLLESKYETLTKDLESARGFLAMLERELVNATQSFGDRTHTDIIADIVVDILSHHQDMHRSRILKSILDRGVHVGSDEDSQKQLAGLSSLLSKDTRFISVNGKNGYWALAKPVENELSEGKSESDDNSQEFHSVVNTRLDAERDDLLAFDKRERASRTAEFRRDEQNDLVQLRPPRAMKRRNPP